MAGLAAVAGTPVKDATLTERLSRASQAIEEQNERLVCALGRVNGTPPSPATGANAPTPQYGLAELVARIENQSKRLADICNGVEQIA